MSDFCSSQHIPGIGRRLDILSISTSMGDMNETLTANVDNIINAYRAASDADITNGMLWYASARAMARSICDDERMGAGIIAALSPMTSWPENVKKARMIVETGDTYGLRRNVEKAQRILAGENPEDVLSGPKVRSFYFNILDIDTVEAVTIDRHAIDVAVGRTLSNDERSKVAGTPKRYREIANMYLDAAARMGAVTGAQLQAIVWVYWRRNRAVAFHGDM